MAVDVQQGPPRDAATLDSAARARGRRLALTSHPGAMTFQRVFTEDLPTLALIGLGASEALVGLQRSFAPASQVLQLPALRAASRVRMRSILLAGQLLAVLCAVPMLFSDALPGLGRDVALAAAMASFALVAAGLAVAETVWFPLLHGYVEPGRVGRFFGLLRTNWHLTLILYFLAAQRWLTLRPGAFGALFLAGWIGGALRIALVARLPEPDGPRLPQPALARLFDPLRRDPRLRRYLAGVVLCGASRRAALPFAIVLMSRSLGFSDAQVLATTLASYTGAFLSLYVWGRIADRAGEGAVFRVTALGGAAALAGLVLLRAPGEASLGLAVALFFALAIFAAGFGVADTQLLFRLAPPQSPTSVLVLANALTSFCYGLAPVAAGIVLDRLLAAGLDPVAGYHGLFVIAAAGTLASYLPLRRVTL